MADETAAPEPEKPPPHPHDVAVSVDPGPYARAHWKVRLAVSLFVLVLVPVTGEGLSRLFAKRELPLWLDHPLCWRIQAPDTTVVHRAGDDPFFYTTNHFGFRGSAVTTAKRPANAYRIAFLGDDATLDPGQPEDKTFPAIIEATLNSRRGENDLHVECLNAGGTGFYAPVVRATLEERVLPLEPDLVVVMSVAADVRAACASGWDERGDGLFRKEPRPSLADWLCGVSDFAYLIRKKARASGVVAPPPSHTPLERLGAQDPKADPKRALAAYTRELHLIARACREVKADLVLLTQPTLYKDSLTPEEASHLPHGADEQLRKGIDLYNEAVRAEAPRVEARLVDEANLVTRDLDHLRDDIHFTPKGHAAVASAFVDEVFKDGPAARRP